jgi:iron complex transport system ATP-binding protein
METVIQSKSLSIGYGKKIIHEQLNVSLYRGEVTCLLGLNGSGKSTLLRTMAGFQPPLAGELLLMNRPMTDYSPSELALTVGIALTEKITAGDLTAYDLVSLGRHPYTGFFGKLRAHDRDVIARALEAVGMTEKTFQPIDEMSDGERQKIMIAKTLAQECPVILMDEPTAFLDVAGRIEMMALLRKLADEQQKSILLSTHDVELAVQTSDRLWLLARNRPLMSGTPETLVSNGSLASLFDSKPLAKEYILGKYGLS